jgi:NADPH:quinone reductase
MKAVVVGNGRGVHVSRMPCPVLGPGQIEIVVRRSLVSSGTELHYSDTMRQSRELFRLGYCAVGEVTALARDVAGPRVGSRVLAMGWQHATHSERICVPQRLVVELPAGLDFDSAVFGGLAATALHATHRGRHRGGERTLVVGLGLVGQLVAQCVRRSSSFLAVADRVPMRCRIACETGADEVFALDRPSEAGAGGFDVVYLCVTGDATGIFARIFPIMARAVDGQPRGRIVCVGRFAASIPFGPELGNVDFRYSARCGAGYRFDPYVAGATDIVPEDGEQTVDANLRQAVEMIATGRIKAKALHTHTVPIAQAADAYALAQRPDQALGVIISYP